MTKEFTVGGVVWRGYRYWANGYDIVNHGAYTGWNTCFVPYRILAITPKRIAVRHEGNTIARRSKGKKDWATLFLDRATMERDGKQYHTRHHEYFYASKPKTDPEHDHAYKAAIPAPTKAMAVLNLTTRPYSKEDVRRAYRRLARTTHPDAGGSHAAFIALKQAHDDALKYAR